MERSYDSDGSSLGSGSESTASGVEEKRKGRRVERCRRKVDVRKGGARVVVRQYCGVREEDKGEMIKKMVKREGTQKVLEVTVEILGVVMDPDDTPESEKFTKTVVRRSMKQFNRFSKRLSEAFPTTAVPIIKPPNPNLPQPPNALQDLPSLAEFLRFVLSHPNTCKSQLLWDFLTLPSDEITEVIREPKIFGNGKGRSINVNELRNDLKKVSEGAKTGAKKLMTAGLKSLKNLKEKQQVDPKEVELKKEAVKEIKEQCQTIFNEIENGEATLRSGVAQAKMVSQIREAALGLVQAEESMGWAFFGCSEMISELCFKASSAYYKEAIADIPPGDPEDQKILVTATPVAGSIAHSVETYAGLARTEYAHTISPSPITLEHRWRYTIVTPAPVHRIRQAPSRTSELVADVTPGQTILLDLTRSLQNGEEWGYSIESGGWTLLSDPGMPHLLPSTLLKNNARTDSEADSRYSPGEVLSVVSSSGKSREGLVLAVSGGMVHVHYMGFDPRCNEWIPATSLRLFPAKPKGEYALQTPAKAVSDAYVNVGRLYLEKESVVESHGVAGVQRTSGLVEAAGRLVKNSRQGLLRAEKIQREFAQSTGEGKKAHGEELKTIVDAAVEGTTEVWGEHEAARETVRGVYGVLAASVVRSHYDRAVREEAYWKEVLEQLEAPEEDLTVSFNDVLRASVPSPPTDDEVLGRHDASDITDLITPLKASQGFALCYPPSTHDDTEYDIFGDAIPTSPHCPVATTTTPENPPTVHSSDLHNLGPLQESPASEVTSDPAPRPSPPTPPLPPQYTGEALPQPVTRVNEVCSEDEDLPVPNGVQRKVVKEPSEGGSSSNCDGEEEEGVRNPKEDEVPEERPSAMDVFQMHLNKMKPLEVDDSLFEEESKKAVRMNAVWDDL
eukprot:TRINITY_DN1224_c0_g2_i2.p1 TRINITY_DN1224_c0_g2~~TRINITY_DN1224_c0_g2_i2.p1  ORF type:complete len:901 (+),score=145.98 TRINITY_DN1224_c0_g2_i2:79-2781(+)